MPPQYIQFGITPGFSADVTAYTVASWKNFDIALEKIGFGTQIAGEDYNWDKTSALLTLNQPPPYGERWNATFSNIIIADSTTFGFGQYPHIISYKLRGVSRQSKCRYQEDSRSITAFNVNGENRKAVIHLPLGGDEIPIETHFTVTNGEVLLIEDKVRNFHKGLLHSRIWN